MNKNYYVALVKNFLPLKWSRPALVPMVVTTAVPLAMVVQCPARALSFRFDFDRNVPDDFRAATQEAGNAWSSVLKDDVIVDLKIEYKDLSPSGAVLGGARPGRVKVKYEDYVEAIFRDAVSANDLSAINSLPLSSEGRQAAQAFQLGAKVPSDLKSKSFDFLLDGRFGNGSNRQPFVDSDGSDNNKSVSLTRAQARALGLGKSGERKLDGLVQLNNKVEWDTNRRDGVSSDRYDATSVLLHEIGHVLGVVSGVDALGFLAASSEPIDLDKNKFSYLTPLDFYRYSSESAALGVADLTLGGSNKYFSLDGGKSPVTNSKGQAAYFSTGSQSVGGNGYQGSHWRPENDPLGVVTPLLKKGQSVDISELDLTLLDSIGWDTEDNSAQQAAAIGLDWQQLTGSLAQQRTAVVDSLVQQWGERIPGLEAAIADASAELDVEFQEKFRKEFNDLLKKADEGKLDDRDKNISKFTEKIQKEADKRNDKIRDLPKKIYEIDEEVSEWLALPTDELSDEVKDASGSEINRFSNLVKAAPASERAALEPRLEAALAQFSDRPDKLLQDLLDSSGPANPYAWGRNYRVWWYYQVANSNDSEIEDIDSPGLLYATADDASNLVNSLGIDSNFEQLTPPVLPIASVDTLGDRDDSATDIPEPSSVLALFGIAVLGLGAARRKR